MYLNSMEVKYQISRRGENLEKSPIGSKLKYVRKHLNLTLEESAEDICSVSYLSKVENNLIKPTAKYVKLLQQRYHMDKDIKDNHTYDDDLEILIQAFIEEKYETTTDKKHKISEDYQEFIINFANLVLSKQYEKGKIIGNELLFYIPNLPTRSLNFALALMNVLLYKDLRFSDAKDLLLLMNIGQEDIKMSIIQKKWLLRNAIKLRQALLFEKIYPEYKDQLIKYQYFNEILEIENTRKCLYQKTTQYYLNTLNDNKDISIIYLNYLNNQQQYAKIIEKTKTKLYNEEYLKMHLFALENIKEYSNIIKLIKNIDVDKINDRSTWLLVRHFKYKYIGSKEELIQYYRNEIMGFKHLTDEVDLLYYFMMDGFRTFKTQHYYKEATEIINKYLPRIKELAQL